jgi:hypothetical protein
LRGHVDLIVSHAPPRDDAQTLRFAKHALGVRLDPGDCGEDPGQRRDQLGFRVGMVKRVVENLEPPGIELPHDWHDTWPQVVQRDPDLLLLSHLDSVPRHKWL